MFVWNIHRITAHIVHLSTADALPMIEKYRGMNAPLSVETCHHYLCLNAEMVPRNGVEFKCCPPIRDAANQEKLWQGIKNGGIHMVVSDHSPSTAAMKLLDPDKPNYGNFLKSWGGISSLQFGELASLLNYLLILDCRIKSTCFKLSIPQRCHIFLKTNVFPLHFP